MDTMRWRRLLSCAVLVTALGVISLAVPVAAGVQIILPEQFQTMTNEASWVRRPLGLQGGNFWAPVSLPVGAQVTKVVWYQWGLNNGGSSSLITLSRVRTALGYATTTGDTLFWGLNYTYTGSTTLVQPSRMALTTPASVESDLVVRAGYRYNVSVSVNSNTIVQGVKVFFDAP